MFKAIKICLGMFTKLPVKITNWEESKGPNAICFLPLAGLACGLFTYCVVEILSIFPPIAPASPALILLSLFCVCGFLHLDGFMDAADSLLSSKDRNEKIAILKDSNVGAFSVIAMCLLTVVLYSALKLWMISEIPKTLFIFVPYFSRAVGALAVLTYRPLSSKGIFAYFRDGVKPYHKIILLLMIAAPVIAAIVASQWALSIVITICAIISLLFAKYARKVLGGINGDIIGAMIVLTETMLYLSMPFAFVDSAGKIINLVG